MIATQIPPVRVATRGERAVGRLQAGLTLIEIMIVLAIIGLIMGLLVGPMVMNSLKDAKVDTAYKMANNIDAAYAKWQIDAESPCPVTIDDLKESLGKRKTDKVNDPWGKPYILKCGDEAPAECEGFCTLSMGVDGKEGTADDVKSWIKPKK